MNDNKTRDERGSATERFAEMFAREIVDSIVRQAEDEEANDNGEPRPFQLPPDVAGSDDLTFRAQQAATGHMEYPFDDDPRCQRLFEELGRALHRRTSRHVLLVGERGVGKSAIVAELARRAHAGQIAFLQGRRVVWVDVRYTPPADAARRLSAVFHYLSKEPEPLVVCLEGLPALLAGSQGEDLRPMLLGALAGASFQLMAPMTPHEFEDLGGDSLEMREFFNRVDVEEPDPSTSEKLLRHFARGLEASHDVTIPDAAVHQAVALTANYVLNEQLPAKALRILRRVCEDLDFERSELGASDNLVTPERVTAAVSAQTGVPVETLCGIAEAADFEAGLSEFVVGQEEAVQAVAQELALIKAGMSDPGKPASVMLFVGQTGTGKTELAKALARFYSTTGKLRVYTMANFIEPHSVAGIIGVPPGYVGHHQGGRLINDLNADPYCVVLLDEADKAHPDVLQPFLNLFDEGWVRDQRGVKAYADKAIIILTTNVAQKMISDLHRTGKDYAEIRDRITGILPQIRHTKAERPVFTPEFLSRLKRIVVFGPLDQEAMQGIAERLVRDLSELWREKRERELTIPEELVGYIAKRAHDKNQKSSGREGGRIVRRLISDLVETQVQKAVTAAPEAYRQAFRVEVLFSLEDEQPEAAGQDQAEADEASAEPVQDADRGEDTEKKERQRPRIDVRFVDAEGQAIETREANCP